MTGMSASYRIRRSVEKNAPEFRALASRRMPAFAVPFGRASNTVPVFCFHDVQPETFAAQLEFLRANGYRTLDADQVAARIRTGGSDPGEVALSFDDATWTFWTYAFPLLREYGFQAILFAIPTTLSDDETEYPTWDDHRRGSCGREELAGRGGHRPFCTWGELNTMHRSGIVDVQSHSLTHVRVPIAPRVLDFVHPGFDPYYGNFDIPLSVLDESGGNRPALRLGAPLFRSAPRLAGHRRFCEAPDLVEELTAFVRSRGGVEFFADPGWRSTLRAIVRRRPASRLGDRETREELATAMHREFAESRTRLEQGVSGAEIRHFAYPWFAGSAQADGIAEETGYDAVFGGPDVDTADREGATGLLRVQRLPDGYLLRLPGRGRRALGSVWRGRIRGPRVEERGPSDASTLETATRWFYWKPATAWFRSLELQAYEAAAPELAKPLLDLGCGNGLVARMLAERGIVDRRALYGIDLQQRDLTQAMNGDLHTGVARADGRRLPFPDAAFGSVVSNGVLCAIPDGVDQVLEEVLRVLRPGGTFVVTVPTDHFVDSLFWPRSLGRFSSRARQIYVTRINRRLDHHGPYHSAEAWCRRLEGNGLKVDRIEGFLSGRAGIVYNLLTMHVFRFVTVLRWSPAFLRSGAAALLRMALRRAYLREQGHLPRPAYVVIVGHRGHGPGSAGNAWSAPTGDE
ncbi:MAG: methyltransferase domain-containing protein [Gemmatimonadales bacterium]|nr:MAG: methyltransferase domain-containing protein [Gemmatimonadales bacterium]